MIRDIALITIFSALFPLQATAAIPRDVEKEVFKELFGSVERLKMDLDGYQINLSAFLEQNLLLGPAMTLNVQNRCTVRNGPEDYVCTLTLKQYTHPSAKGPLRKKAYVIDYLAAENQTGEVSVYPWSAEYRRITGKGLKSLKRTRYETDFERQAFKGLLKASPDIRLKLVRENPTLARLIAQKLLVNTPVTLSFENRCQLRSRSDVYQCSLTIVAYQWSKRRSSAQLQTEYSLQYNAGGSLTTGIALPGRFRSVSYQ